MRRDDGFRLLLGDFAFVRSHGVSLLIALAVQLRLVEHGERWPQVKVPTYHSSLGTAEKQHYNMSFSSAGHSVFTHVHCPQFYTAGTNA